MPCKSLVHDYDFDPCYGMDLGRLLDVVPPTPPPDFADFWRRRYAAAMAQAPRPRTGSTGQVLGNHTVHELRFDSTDGVEIGGWLLLPLAGPPRRGVLIGHGYGGRALPVAPFGLDDAALLFPCFRGMGASPVAGISPHPALHVVHEIEDRDRYILGGCVEDLWLGVSALLALFPEVAGHLSYQGSSFGGGIGALATPWDRRIGHLYIEVPTFGHHGLRMVLPCVGSCDAVRNYQRHHSFDVMKTLTYYDAACAARNLRIPTLVAAALFDPVVPPPGQFAIYNAIPASWRRLFLLQAGHFDYPGRQARDLELTREAANFLMEP